MSDNDRSLDHLIYDGMGQIQSDGKVLGSVRPTEPDWQLFTENFDYVKDWYQVRLPNGEIVDKCWPNDGRMNAQDQRNWGPNDKVFVRPDTQNLIG